MKRNFTVNISGKIFHIDEDAYELLTNTINTFETFINDTPHKQAIIDEIEYIIAKKLHKKTPKSLEQKIITKENILGVLNKLELPSDNSEVKAHKKLFRQAEKKILGGVCNGLAHFFNLPRTLFRIIFIILTLAFGLGTVAYILMWMYVPVANTPIKKIMSKGIAITPENINNYIHTSIASQKSSNKFKETLKKIIIAPTPLYINTNSSILKAILKFLVSLIILELSIFLISGIIYLVSHSDNPNFLIQNITNYQQLSQVIFGFKQTILVFSIALFLTIFIPSLSLLLIGINILSSRQFRNNFIKKTFRLLFTLGLVTLFLFVCYTYIKFLFVDKHQTIYSFRPTQNNITHIDFEKEKYKYSDFSKKWILINDTIYGIPEVLIDTSNSDSLHIIVLKKSSGSTMFKAEKNINIIHYEPSTINNEFIFLHPYFNTENNKWKAQNVRVIIKIPEGRKFSISDDIAHALKREHSEITLKSNTQYIVSKGAIKSI